MNILIVGNGFDLSHYLPTKYDHFMIAMDAIENWNTAKGDMSFDDLFIKDYWHKNNETGEEWQNSFFKYTKAMYQTEEIKVSVDEKIFKNCWYKYFKHYKSDLQTWIDLECQIEKALEIVAIFINEIEELLKKGDRIDFKYDNLSSQRSNILKVHREHEHILFLLGVFIVAERVQTEKGREWLKLQNQMGSIKIGDKYHCIINPDFILDTGSYMKLDCKKIINYLNVELENFICLFGDYISHVVEKLIQNRNIKLENYFEIDSIYSFNYTPTFSTIYNQKTKVHYLHGSVKVKNSIVLGISELHDELLKKYKSYGFVKYHQKLLKNTDYLFLDEYKHQISRHTKELASFEKEYEESYKKQIRRRKESEGELNLNFIIWGHSLDSSDKEYILDLFSLNDDMDRKVRVVVYYYDDNAKFMLLNNLLDILKKDKVEKWMKNGWLKFEPNPDIAKLNNIAPVDLPKPEQMA